MRTKNWLPLYSGHPSPLYQPPLLSIPTHLPSITATPPLYQPLLPSIPATPPLSTNYSSPLYWSPLPSIPTTPPLYTGHPTPLYRPPLPSISSTPPLYTSHPSPLNWLPFCTGHLFPLYRPPHPSILATPLYWPPLYTGHPSILATPLYWLPLLCTGHSSPIVCPLLYTDHPTPLYWPPLYIGHISLLYRPHFYTGHPLLYTSHPAPLYRPILPVPGMGCDVTGSLTGMEMLAEFPQMVVQNEAATEYSGYITAGKMNFRLDIKVPRSGHLKEAIVDCDWHLYRHLQGYTSIIKQRLNQSSSIVSFLRELKTILERQMSVDQSAASVDSQTCASVIAEIETVGWSRLVSVDADFKCIQFKYTDEKEREHILNIQLHSQHPQNAPQCVTDLPKPFSVHWTQSSTLKDVFSQFQTAVNTFQDFWNLVGEVDANTLVLEPEKPAFCAAYRRIAVETNASIHVTMDPKNPRLFPECRFLGADQVVQPLRQKLNSNLHLWNPERSLLQNLELLLDIKFPSPKTSEKEEFSVECGICYSFRLETEIPDEACNDTRCRQPFHRTCLYEWLKALPSSRQSFNTIFGECPYCSKPITVKMPSR
ncbi:hypothetical protein ScPMuIL_013694 [Solemya velum]